MREAKLVVTAVVVLVATGIQGAGADGRPRSAMAELAEAVEALRARAIGAKPVALAPERRPERVPRMVSYPSYVEMVDRFLSLPGERPHADRSFGLMAGGAAAASAASQAQTSGWIPVGSGIIEHSKGDRYGLDRTGRATSLRWAQDQQQDALTMYVGSRG